MCGWLQYIYIYCLPASPTSLHKHATVSFLACLPATDSVAIVAVAFSCRNIWKYGQSLNWITYIIPGCLVASVLLFAAAQTQLPIFGNSLVSLVQYRFSAADMCFQRFGLIFWASAFSMAVNSCTETVMWCVIRTLQ